MIIIKVDCSAQILAVMDNITQASLKSLVIFFYIVNRRQWCFGKVDKKTNKLKHISFQQNDSCDIR